MQDHIKQTNHTDQLNLNGGTRMNKQKVWFWMVVRLALLVLSGLLLVGCSSNARVGTLRTESQSVELGNAKSARVEIAFGAGDLQVSGGAGKLLEADFNYNVAALKPEVGYTGDTLFVRQPEVDGLPSLQNITDFRNDWDLRLDDQVPLDLSVDAGAGSGDLQLAGLSLTGLDITLGGGEYTIDLSGDWPRDLDVTIDAGATDIRLLLPSHVGARVWFEDGPHLIDAAGMLKDGPVYTNTAYGVSPVTLHINIASGIGLINLEVAEAAAAPVTRP
jgi:outer membrane murein-binding lipoprotein Lpp